MEQPEQRESVELHHCYQLPAWTGLSFPLVWLSSTPPQTQAGSTVPR